jgi:hypothetical protein
MPPNLDRYQSDLDSLLEKGKMLVIAVQAKCFPKEIEQQMNAAYGEKAKAILDTLPSVGIPAKPNTKSGMNPNGIPGMIPNTIGA